jgi:hypothetical protein
MFFIRSSLDLDLFDDAILRVIKSLCVQKILPTYLVDW